MYMSLLVVFWPGSPVQPSALRSHQAGSANSPREVRVGSRWDLSSLLNGIPSALRLVLMHLARCAVLFLIFRVRSPYLALTTRSITTHIGVSSCKCFHTRSQSSCW